MTFSYPSLKPSEKVSGTPTRVYKSSKSSKSDSTPWKYGEDGSVSGVLGGGKKRTPLEAYQKSQTDILKDQVYAEKAQRLRADEEVKSTRPKQNEINDRRLARLGIKIDTSPEKSEAVIFTPKENPKKKDDEELASDKSSKADGTEKEKEEKGDGSDDAMVISDEEEVQPQEKRKKRRKKEKTVKSKPSDSKVIDHI